jgi:carboxyl-terminal processing protease
MEIEQNTDTTKPVNQTESKNNEQNNLTTFNNKKSVIYSPIIFSLVLSIGILLGYYINRSQSSRPAAYNHKDKIDMLLDLIETNYVDSISRQDLIESTIPEILTKLDPHSVYIPATEMQEVQEPLDGNFDGIGVQFNIQNDTILVIATIAGGPSDKLGILAGDRIISINDSVFAGKPLKNEDVVKNLKGPRGTKVKVGIARRGIANLMYFDITRDKIPLYSIDASCMLNQNIGFIKINRFARTTHEEFVNAVNKLRNLGMKKLVVDVRSNSGGYLDEAISIADEFLSNDVLIVYTEGKNRKRETYHATDKGTCNDIETAILVDAWSASASEIFAGALQDNDRGIILGQRTFGKGLVQEPIIFRDSSEVRLTIARYFTPTGRCIQKSYKNGTEAYYNDIHDRAVNGEFEQADSTHFPDSLKFTTPKGKVVYGGGGIMPDIFVPVDTSGSSKFLSEITSKGLIYKYALDYADKNRNTLSKFKSAEEFVSFLKAQQIFENFISYTKQQGIKETLGEIKISRKIIETQLMAYISRNIIDSDGFYPIIQKIDKTLQIGIRELEKSEELKIKN